MAYCPLIHRLMKRKSGQVSADAQQIPTSWRQKMTLMMQLGNHGIVGQKKGVWVSHARAAITSRLPTLPPSSHKFWGVCGSRSELSEG